MHNNSQTTRTFQIVHVILFHAKINCFLFDSFYLSFKFAFSFILNTLFSLFVFGGVASRGICM